MLQSYKAFFVNSTDESQRCQSDGRCAGSEPVAFWRLVVMLCPSVTHLRPTASVFWIYKWILVSLNSFFLMPPFRSHLLYLTWCKFILNIYNQEGQAVREGSCYCVFQSHMQNLKTLSAFFRDTFIPVLVWFHVHTHQELLGAPSQHLGEKDCDVFAPAFGGSSFQPLLCWRINGTAAVLLCLSCCGWRASGQMQFPGHCFWCVKLSRRQE